MNIAMFFHLRCFHTLRVWLRQAVTGAAPQIAIQSVASCTYPARAAATFRPRTLQKVVNAAYATQPIHPPRPLRIVQVREEGQRGYGGGRMVISGSMADVCAELDRLAAREANPS